jgi:DNA-binding MarR family transcriptional regulator
MTDQDRPVIKTMARALRTQSRNSRVKVFLSYLYTSDIVNRYLDAELTDEKVTRAGYAVLHFLILKGGSMIPTTISKKTARSKYSVTRIIDTLEKQGLVERLSKRGDRRAKRVSITPQGLEAVKCGTLTLRQRLCDDIFRTLSKNQITELEGILREVRKNVFSLLKARGAEGTSEE